MHGNREWQKKLQERFTSGHFPQAKDIYIDGDQERVTITLREGGLYGNMQTDAAAFEAWSLVLLVHCDVKNIAINLEEKEDVPAKKLVHFERLLYRLARFAQLFPERIHVDNSTTRRARALCGKVRLVLNEPGGKRPSTENQLEPRFEKIITNPDGHSEGELELALEVSDAFRKELGLDKVMRQWPVGLFKERVAAAPEQRIFSGGKSAIDLIGIRSETLVLVELKKDGNSKVGALSELLFYSSMMRDALKGIFEFDGGSPAGNCAITRADILGCSNIGGVLLAPSIHPLLLDPKIIAELNLAAERHWADLPVRFEALRIAAKPTKRGEDFVFDRPVHVA